MRIRPTKVGQNFSEASFGVPYLLGSVIFLRAAFKGEAKEKSPTPFSESPPHKLLLYFLIGHPKNSRIRSRTECSGTRIPSSVPSICFEICFFPLLVLNGAYHYVNYLVFFQGSKPNGRSPVQPKRPPLDFGVLARSPSREATTSRSASPRAGRCRASMR